MNAVQIVNTLLEGSGIDWKRVAALSRQTFPTLSATMSMGLDIELYARKDGGMVEHVWGQSRLSAGPTLRHMLRKLSLCVTPSRKARYKTGPKLSVMPATMRALDWDDKAL